MMTNKCSKTGSLTLLDIQTKADPCPLQKGATSNHVVTFDNQRGDNLYDVVILVGSYGKSVEFPGSQTPTERRHEESVVPAGSSDYKLPMQASQGKSALADEITTSIAFYDSTQKMPAGYWGEKEGTSIKYTLNIQ